MQPVEIIANKYWSRKELEDYIKNEFGEDINANRSAGHTILGTRQELKSLNLSQSDHVWGIKCVLLDSQ